VEGLKKVEIKTRELLLRIRGIPGSYLGPGTKYLDWDFRRLPR
jgi:hypothetical protein